MNRRIFLFMAIAALVTALPLCAQETFWTGGSATDGNFNDSTNWDLDPPNSWRHVNKDGDDGSQIATISEDVVINNLWVGDSGHKGLVNQIGGNMTASAWIQIGGADVAGQSVYNMTGGTLTKDLHAGTGWNAFIGTGSGGSGLLEMSGSSVFNCNSTLFVGSGGGTGLIRVLGGAQLIVTGEGADGLNLGDGSGCTGELVVGDGADNPYVQVKRVADTGGWVRIGNLGGSGTVTVNSGSVDFTAADAILIGPLGSTAVWNQNGGTSNTGAKQLYFGETNGSTPANVTLNLRGGVFATSYISPWDSGAGSTGQINFDGGILKANASQASFIDKGSANYSINVLAGGAVIDTGYNDIGIALPFLADGTSTGGGLTVNGFGTLRLSGASTYTGATTIQTATTLALTASGSLATTELTMEDYSTLVLGSGKRFANALNSATLGYDSTLNLSLTDSALEPSSIDVTKSGGSNVLNLASGTGIVNLTVGTAHREFDAAPYTVFNYGSVNGTASNLNVTIPGIRATAVATVGATSVQLTISTNAASLVWNPVMDETWEAFGNWLNAGNPDTFYNLDDVLFTDAGFGSTGQVTFSSTLHPRDIVVDNATSDFAFIGAGNITGIGTTLTKNGAGKLTLGNAGTNDYTGNVTLNGGTIAFSSSSALGRNNTITVNGGVLNWTPTGSVWAVANGYSQKVVIEAGAKGTFAGGIWIGVGGATGELTVNGIAECTASSKTFRIGEGVGSYGIVTTNAGSTMSATGNIVIGYNGGKGKMTMNGGTASVGASKYTTLGHATTGDGELILNGDSTFNAATFHIAQNGKGVVTVGDGTGVAKIVAKEVYLGYGSTTASTAEATLNVNAGGIVEAQFIRSRAGTSVPVSSILNLNGGTLKATLASAAFIVNVANATTFQANVQAGGVTINSNGLDIGIPVVLAHSGAGPDGGLKKIGGGTLTLSALPTYNGNTVVNQGALNASAGLDTPDAEVYVATGATLNAPFIVADALTIGGEPRTAASAVAVPEPGTLTLLVFAITGIAFVARRKR